MAEIINLSFVPGNSMLNVVVSFEHNKNKYHSTFLYDMEKSSEKDITKLADSQELKSQCEKAINKKIDEIESFEESQKALL